MGNKNFFYYEGQKYKIWLNQDGYACVTRGHGKEKRPYLLHRLIIALTYGGIPSGVQIHHRDGDRSNWLLQNLQIIDPTEHCEIHRQITM